MQNEVINVKEVITNLDEVLKDYLQYQIVDLNAKLKMIANNSQVNLNVLHDRDMSWQDLNKQILKDHKFMLDEQNKERFEKALEKFVFACSKAKEAIKTINYVKDGFPK